MKRNGKNTKGKKQLNKLLLQLQPTEAQDGTYKRLVYVRYADDFLIGVIGSKEDAKAVKAELAVFLKAELHLNLSQEKTLVTHSSRKAHFLGYDIKVQRDTSLIRRKDGSLQRAYHTHEGCGLLSVVLGVVTQL